ncbi:MAG: vanadium-dependent haloperoxidase [Acidobacteria bacterium]|nr:vanadium-dependent haloperoxidase [Acidobacteriota bacterium]
MRAKTLSKGLKLTLGLGIVVSMITAFPWWSDASATGRNACSRLSSQPAATPVPAQATDVVMEWNQQAAALSLLPASALAPVQQTRAMAIFHVAVHDAVNGITGEYETYLSPSSAPESASPQAAAIAAAHHTLKNLFSGHDTLLDDRYVNSLAANGLSPSDSGIEYGRAAAAAILSLRANDRAGEAQFAYDAPGAGDPGVWARLNNAPALLPGFGNVTPFVLRSGSQFRPEPPPALDSEQYTKDYNEIKQIGIATGSTRKAEQSQIATFWRASPTAIWNNVLTQVVLTRNLDLSGKARVFALFYLAAADASIACWEAKYFYNFWRPQPAIRMGDFDDNDLTAGNVTWQPFVATPPHPEYPSGHTANSSAMAKILDSEFGDNAGPIAVTLTGITRSWNTFNDAVEEVIDARVYSGIHFRNSDKAGARMGRQIAQFVSKHALRKRSKSH